ncbi:MAG: hypothetical protein EOO01_27780, partial [Chitinophagaceae bacterium]
CKNPATAVYSSGLQVSGKFTDIGLDKDNNITFIKSQPCRFPNLVLLRDFLTFTCNMKNPRLVNTHLQNVELLVNSCRGE